MCPTPSTGLTRRRGDSEKGTWGDRAGATEGGPLELTHVADCSGWDLPEKTVFVSRAGSSRTSAGEGV